MQWKKELWKHEVSQVASEHEIYSFLIQFRWFMFGIELHVVETDRIIDIDRAVKKNNNHEAGEH